VGCARLGLHTLFLLRTGDDEAGELQRAALAAAGVDLRHARAVPGAASAHAFILLDHRGERSVLWQTPAALAVRPEEIAPELLDGVDAVFLDGMDGAASLRLAQLARQRGIPALADLDRVYPHTEPLLPWLDHVIVPESFPLRPERATWVVTQGARGATAYPPGQAPLPSPAFPVTVVDTTGAGDAFHAGYTFALLRGDALPERLRFANAAAALACTALGAQAALPRLDQVEALLQKALP
jgi:sulfofructose kinase